MMEKTDARSQVRIGFVTLSHRDYQDEAAEVMRQKAIACLKSGNADIVAPDGDITDFETGWRAGQQLAGKDLAGVILFLSTWVECSAVMALVREVEHLPLFLWGYPMFRYQNADCSTGSYVSYAMVKGSLDRGGYRFTKLLALPDESVIPTLHRFIVAAGARQALRREKIGLIGYTSMSIYPGSFDHLFLRRFIGPEVDHVDSYSLIRLAERASEQEIKDALSHLQTFAQLAEDVSSEALRKSMGIYVALHRLCQDRHWAGFTIKCQYEFSKEYAMAPCVPVSLMAEEGVSAACEGDMLCAVSMRILFHLSGKVTAYGDAIHHAENTLKLSSCGMLPFSLGQAPCIVRKFMPHDGFTGIQSSFVMRPERVTILRLIENCGSYILLYATGLGQETALRQGYMPALDILLDGDVNALVEAYAGQHFAIVYGDYGEELHSLAAMMGLLEIRI